MAPTSYNYNWSNAILCNPDASMFGSDKIKLGKAFISKVPTYYFDPFTYAFFSKYIGNLFIVCHCMLKISIDIRSPII